MLYDLKHTGKAAQLLTSDNVKTINKVADFLVEAEDVRVEIAKKEEEREGKAGRNNNQMRVRLQ